MAKANCTQEPEVLDLKTLFHELIILAEAQQPILGAEERAYIKLLSRVFNILGTQDETWVPRRVKTSSWWPRVLNARIVPVFLIMPGLCSSLE